MIINVEHGFNYTRAWLNDGRKNHRTLDRRYYIGETKPNYPMPALRVSIEILPTRVVCWHRNNGHLDYYYMA